MDGQNASGATLQAAGLLAVTALALASCHAPPVLPPPEPAALSWEVTHFRGSPVTGPLGSPAAGAPGTETAATGALPLEITIAGTTALPAPPLAPLERHARLIAVLPDAEPLAGVTRGLRGARCAVVSVDDPLAVRLLAPPQSELPDLRAASLRFDTAIVPGGTTCLRGELPLPVAGADVEVRAVEAQVYRAKGGGDAAPPPPVEIAVVAECTYREEPLGAGAAVTRREIVVLRPVELAPGRVAIVTIPGRLAGAADGLLALLLRVAERPADPAAFARAVNASLESELRPSARPASSAAPVRPDWPAILAVLGNLPPYGDARAAVLFLAEGAGARIAADLVVAAPAEVVESLAATCRDRARTGDVTGPEDLAWHLEKSALKLLLARAETGALSPGLEAVLRHGAGPLARRPTALAAVLAAAADLEDLHRRLLRENFGFLAASSPVERVGAFDWLAARGRAPAGYDPLAPREARRAALAGAVEGDPSPRGGEP